MKMLKQRTKNRQYKCPECDSIIEISDGEFKTTKEYAMFPHLMGLRDFQEDAREKFRICDCPVCGATIRKELNACKGE